MMSVHEDYLSYVGDERKLRKSHHELLQRMIGFMQDDSIQGPEFQVGLLAGHITMRIHIEAIKRSGLCLNLADICEELLTEMLKGVADKELFIKLSDEGFALALAEQFSTIH